MNRIQGDGAFDFSEEEDNSSIVVNATVYDFFQESINGDKTGDRIHVDGTFSGDVNGDFGTVRDIIASNHTQVNATGEEFDVNVIFHRIMVQSVLESATTPSISRRFTIVLGNMRSHKNTGTIEPYVCDGIPWKVVNPPKVMSSRSEVQSRAIERFHEAESTLGDVDITRETGIAPAELLVGDRIDLLGF